MDVECVAGRFRLAGLVGAGNMGEVHRAEDLHASPTASGQERHVAVKTVLRRRSGAPAGTDADAGAVERFAREVRIMRMLDDHPNLPRTIDGGVDGTNGGLPYLVMELLDGRPLSDLVAEENRLPLTWVAAIGAQIANGLAAAHTAGIVHRDLKPANVMLTRGGLVKVLDFGMGRITDDVDGTRLTSTGVTVGTARYMAPEQFEAGLVTQAADLYALGCVLYEALVGVPPFVGDSAYELADRHVNDVPPPLALLRGDVPQGLARLVGRLLAKKPADRPVDAVAVREALLPFADADCAPARLPGWDAFAPVGGLAAALADRLRAPAPPVRRGDA
ncbi:serine/threonine-protein kinase, partial [Streptomyces meridianus]